MSGPATELIERVPKRLLVGGRWLNGGDGGSFPVEDPATELPLAEVAEASEADALAALDAASETQPTLAAMAPRERADVLMRAFAEMRARREELALLVTLEMGKPLADARAEVAYAAEFLRWFAEEAVRVHGRYSIAPEGTSRLLTTKQPVGPSLLITPWNFPLAMVTRKVGPALAAGCAAIVKPAPQTPLSCLELGAILERAGAPPGALNLLPTSRSAAVVEVLLADGRLRKLSFTGSTEVGRVLARAAGDGLLRTSLELGGNAPFIVFEDADVEAAIEGAVLAKMRNVGQSCTAANRFLVAEPLAQRFTEGLARRLGSLRLGPGTRDGVEVGPLIDATQRARAAGLVDDALACGAARVAPVPDVPSRGHFLAPCVLSAVDPASAVARSELFAPIAPVMTFRDEDEAIALANDTPHGLVAFAYTKSLARALRVIEALETGMVGVNRGLVSNAAAPFGGIKHSGLGREGGPEGIDEYLETKYAALG